MLFCEVPRCVYGVSDVACVYVSVCKCIVYMCVCIYAYVGVRIDAGVCKCIGMHRYAYVVMSV